MTDTEALRVFRRTGYLGQWPGYADAYAGDSADSSVRWSLVDGTQRAKAYGNRPSEGWERASSAIRFAVGERPTLEAAIWPTLTANATEDTATLKTAVDAAAVAAGFTLGSP